MAKVQVHIGKIPRPATAADLVDLLEKAVGKGTVNKVDIKTNPITCESKGFGFVSFNTKEAAERAAMLGMNGHLVLLNSRLQVNLADRDIVKRPRHSETTWEDGKLYLCSLISETHARWQWSSSLNVTTEFDFNRKIVQFMVHVVHNLKKQQYKMESEFEEIESVKLVLVQGAPNRALLLQLKTPPHLYLQRLGSAKSRDLIANLFSSSPVADPHYLHTEEEELWVRTVDFTPEKSIGQCLTYLLELSCSRTGDDLNDLFQKLADFRLAAHPPLIQQLILEKGKSFATSQVLVPIVNAAPELKVPFDLLYKVNQLVQTSKLIGETLDLDFYSRLSGYPREEAKLMLETWGKRVIPCWDPVQEMIHRQRSNEVTNVSSRNPVSVKLAPGLSWVRRVLVTPTKVYCTGPEVDTSNRVTRHFSSYSDRFMRMSFVDENFEQMKSTSLSVPTKGGAQAGVDAERSPLYHRILAALKEGFVLGGHRFEFLAFSSSQLREQSVWMFASDATLTAASIRTWMGDFLTIRNVAKCAARMGQCFSSSTPTLEVHEHEVDQIPDVEREDEFGVSTYCFSDGIGKISKEFAKEVAKKYGAKKLQTGIVPSAFQIRYGGYKGVVAVDPLSKFKLSLRPSMRKFASKHVGLDILNTSRFLPSYLNRQIIMLLSTLGVKDSVFEQMQHRVVSQLDDMLKDADLARDFLQINHSGAMHTRLIELLASGFRPQIEPYVKMLLQAFRICQLSDLQKRSRILEPKGRVLMGCLDETKALSYGEIFLQVTPAPGRRKRLIEDGLEIFDKYPVGPTANGNEAHVVTGWVVVAKNPCLHPGDIRKLKAVNVPALRHMVDCLVFPQKGHRPHPNECSGSDLDGDLYFVSWNEDLIPPVTDDPMDYTSPGAVTLDHPVSIEEIQEFFVKYMVNDSLGVISNAHVVHADSQPAMARSIECRELAKLVSIAVDFPKTGVPAIIPQNLRPRKYPDFMEKDDKDTYRSERVLGKLFRQVRGATLEKIPSEVPKEDIVQAFDVNMVVRGYEEFIDIAKFHKNMYDRKLIGLMNQYGIETEAEAVSGNILNLARQHIKRRGDVIERIRDAVSSLIDEARQWFDRNVDELVDDDINAKASAWYYVTYHPDHIKVSTIGRREVHLLSFPWVVYDVLLHIKNLTGPSC
ncbi:hypothetical protein M758_3G033400 [Ceratodon purpureus]|nr:hypothetical protein M758_3G033400 [Ceratodon purpureus]